jgi:SHS2 domain-containing protein
MKKYELIEHTADIGIRVKGADLKGLFENAALAMFDIIAEKKGVADRRIKKVKIELKADDSEELFINWLNELLSLSSVKDLIFSAFQINKLAEGRLEAVVSGSAAGNYRLNVEIKAATYHALKIAQAGTGWQAEVIFDV